MTSVNDSGNVYNYRNEVNDNLSTNNSVYTGAISGAAAAAKSVEADLISAYSLKAGDAGLEQLAKDYGIVDENGKAIKNPEAIQLAVKSKYEATQRAFATLSQMLSNVHSLMMQVISRLRFN